jgi:hypothetical protein
MGAVATTKTASMVCGDASALAADASEALAGAINSPFSENTWETGE